MHWKQWSAGALAEAVRRDVPILLSVGYAACHWCHVMAHESFEDDQVAAAMNEFVCIKVDREERPDLDAVYMNATVAMTGHGGWPMTCFLTPDGRPSSAEPTSPKRSSWHCWRRWARPGGTAARGGRAGQRPHHWRTATNGRRTARWGPEIQPALCDGAVGRGAARGGRRPRRFRRRKFPPSALLEALIRSHERTASRRR